jgi:hypothetical protein
MVCCLCQQLESVKFAVTYHDFKLMVAFYSFALFL